MNIKVRKTMIDAREVIVTHDSLRIDMGLLDEAECRQLATTLQEAIDDLLHGFDK